MSFSPTISDNYYTNRELAPHDMLDDIKRAKIVITNYHAFKLRERVELSSGGRALLKGRTGPHLQTTETEGHMIQRVMPDLMGMKNILALNDEGHHCYREKASEPDDEDLKGDEKRGSSWPRAPGRYMHRYRCFFSLRIKAGWYSGRRSWRSPRWCCVWVS